MNVFWVTYMLLSELIECIIIRYDSNKYLAFRQIISSMDFFLSYRTDSTDSRTFNVFILLNGWICLHGVLD